MVLELAALHLHDTADLAADGLHLARWAVLGHDVGDFWMGYGECNSISFGERSMAAQELA